MFQTIVTPEKEQLVTIQVASSTEMPIVYAEEQEDKNWELFIVTVEKRCCFIPLQSENVQFCAKTFPTVSMAQYT